jgi:Spondin_N
LSILSNLKRNENRMAFFSRFACAFALLVTCVNGADLRGNDQRQEMVTRMRKWSVRLTNLAYMQVIDPFIVMSHNNSAARLFVPGEVASAGLEILAEEGNVQPLVDSYTGSVGVKMVAKMGTGQLLPGKSWTFMVETSDMFPFVSLASMAIDTNDCFVGINRMRPSDGLRIDSPGYDAGTEMNDEMCINIPGPACSAFPKTNRTDMMDKGEGFIHVHRGVHGVGDLEASVYDWRNPMLRVMFTRMY